MATHVWGDKETEFFYNLTPDTILDAVELAGYKCTGRCMALNSMENRVYDIEIEVEDESLIKSKFDRSIIAKFYRPGRWSKEQILEEHQFLKDLQDNELPAVAPIPFSVTGQREEKSTLNEVPETGIWYSIFPKKGGRSPDELNEDQVLRVGRLLARMHNVGSKKPASHRIKLTPTTYGRENLKYLLESEKIPAHYQDSYKSLVNQLCDLADPHFEKTSYQRVHGDCHLGNILWNQDEFFLVDFDDMVVGPCVQDIWLVLPGRDEYSLEIRDKLLNSYEVMREFDRSTLCLIEPLRALRYIHFTAWIAKRWSDPAFQRAFPYFGTEKYWNEQLVDLREQLQLSQAALQYQSYYHSSY